MIFFDMACQFDDYRASDTDVRKTSFAQWLERAFLQFLVPAYFGRVFPFRISGF